MPRRSKHKKNYGASAGSTTSAAPSRKKLTPEEYVQLCDAMREMLGGREPRDFQLEMVRAQEEGEDALCHAATGSGKTAIAAGPYALSKNVGRVTFMVSPLIGLQNEMVETFENDFKLAAIAINSARGPSSPDIVKAICTGQFQIVLISPEMILSQRFLNDVLRNHDLQSRVYAIVVDEAHCISHWGAAFRKKYGSLGVVRAFLPKPTPVIAISASLTRRVCRDISQKLQFERGYIFKNLGNDRPNVSIVVRAIHNPLHSYIDLDFLIPADVRCREDLKKSWVYADNIEVGAEIIDHLRTLIPERLHGTIRPYNAVHSVDYRKVAMEYFKAGKIRILVCTDAAGMGCNIPDIDIIVQWKLPAKLSSFVQRAGRAARGPDTVGLSVLLVEPTVYSVQVAQPKSRGRGKKKQEPSQVDQVSTTNPQQSKGKEYARSHGHFRGGHDANDALPPTPSIDTPFSEDDESEGAYLFVQTTSCRRNILRTVFVNPVPQPVVPCCDVCDPTLLDLVRPGLRHVSTTKKLTYSKQPDTKVLSAIREWRQKVLIDDKHPSYLPAAYILPDEAILKLAALSPCSEAAVKGYLSPQWDFWERYGSDITTVILSTRSQSREVIPRDTEDRRATTNTPSPHTATAEEASSSGPPPFHLPFAQPLGDPSDLFSASSEQSPQVQLQKQVPAPIDAPIPRNDAWSQSQPHLPLPFTQPLGIPSEMFFSSTGQSLQPQPQPPKRSRHAAATSPSPRNDDWSQSQSHFPFSQSFPVHSDQLVTATEEDPRRQKRARHAATNRPKARIVTAESKTRQQSQSLYAMFSQPPLVVPSNDVPARPSAPSMPEILGHPEALRVSAASTPVPSTSRVYSQSVTFAAAHSPYYRPNTVASPSPGSYRYLPPFGLRTPGQLVTPTQNPASLRYYHQRPLPFGYPHSAPTFGPLFQPFSPFPTSHGKAQAAQPEEEPKNLNFSSQ